MIDVAVVGGGAAGSELALRLDRAGISVVLATTSLDTVYTGGSPFSQAADLTGIAAEQSFAVQSNTDRLSRWELHSNVKQVLEQQSSVHLMQSSVEQLHRVDDGWSVETWEGVPILARRVVLAVGTFLNPELRIGNTTEASGRLGEIAYPELFHWLTGEGVPMEQCTDTGVNDDGISWSRRYWTLPTSRSSNFSVVGLPHVYAIGRCRRDCRTYDDAVADAQQLADYLSLDET